MDSVRIFEDRRCWPCTLANSVAGLVIAWIPLAAMLLAGNRSAVPLAAAWGVLVTTYAAYRVVGHGALPLVERIARETGLHDRIGPEIDSGEEKRDGDQETNGR